MWYIVCIYTGLLRECWSHSIGSIPVPCDLPQNLSYYIKQVELYVGLSSRHVRLLCTLWYHIKILINWKNTVWKEQFLSDSLLRFNKGLTICGVYRNTLHIGSNQFSQKSCLTMFFSHFYRYSGLVEWTQFVFISGLWFKMLQVGDLFLVAFVHLYL